MTSGTDNSSSQTDFFELSSSQTSAHPHFAELCNALYERELYQLATQGPSQIQLLRRRLSGLSHHVKRAAYFLANNDAPIEVDSHNASWQGKQAAKCPGYQVDGEKNAAWFARHAQHGLVVPVRVALLDTQHVELDSVDRVLPDERKLHVNKHGWFHFSGEPLAEASSAPLSQHQLLRPTKPIMTAACCGHAWNHKGKTSPRALSLREMLLSGTIDWKTFRLTKPR
ncbi:hypothetical protein [Alteromonas sp. H39]|uniref:hypothetical protein n=1 Tax=Alteromonas sp. H39 TaxID=3389876 RepID=UPI0039E18235